MAEKEWQHMMIVTRQAAFLVPCWSKRQGSLREVVVLRVCVFVTNKLFVFFRVLFQLTERE